MTRRWAVIRIVRTSREIATESGGTTTEWCDQYIGVGRPFDAPCYADAVEYATALWPDYALLDRLEVRELLRLPGT